MKDIISIWAKPLNNTCEEVILFCREVRAFSKVFLANFEMPLYTLSLYFVS